MLQVPIKVHDGIRVQNDGFKGIIKVFLVNSSPQIYSSCDLREAAGGGPSSHALALQIVLAEEMHLHMDVVLRRQGSPDFITANDVCGRSDLVYGQCQAWHNEEVLNSYKALSCF